jgi:Tfp pilus assembly protein PilX
MNTKNIVTLLVVVGLIVLAVVFLDRRREPNERDFENAVNRAGANIEEGVNDARRSVEDLTE